MTYFQCSTAMLICGCVLFLNIWIRVVVADGILYPQDSETRQVENLNGLWNFRAADTTNQEQGFTEQWFTKPLDQTGSVDVMPVPSSFNDVDQNAALRDHTGWVWYDRTLFVPKNWQTASYNVKLRFGSAHYVAVVWVNGVQVANHSGGFLPFEADVTNVVSYGAANRLTVALNNTLTPLTLPQGYIQWYDDPIKYPPGYNRQRYDHKYFNYAGIHRSVFLYAVPRLYVDDISVSTTAINANSGSISYNVTTKGSGNGAVQVTLYDKNGQQVASSASASGTLNVANANLWWPRRMNAQVGYLYTLHVQIRDSITAELTDSYRLRVGIRTMTWDSNGVYINGRAVYFQGFGRHEDNILRGRGYDPVTLIKDFNLMEWTEANSFRTNHYPYSEELMDLADEMGFMVINEAPAAELDGFGAELLAVHTETLKEMYARDKNRPSVVMWSLGSDTQSQKGSSRTYWQALIGQLRAWDPSRPVTLVLNRDVSVDVAGGYFDVVCINRFYSWDSDPGHTELIQRQMATDVAAWRDKYGKPIIITAYGADTLGGLHLDPPFTWTEEYQEQVLTQHFTVFDELHRQGLLIGEMVANFADFHTRPATTRVIGDRKGVFTRERIPKKAAFTLRDRGFHGQQYTTDAFLTLFSPRFHGKVAIKVSRSKRPSRG